MARPRPNVGQVSVTSQRSNPYAEIGLSRTTSFVNENGETVEVKFDDLERIREIGSGRYGVVLKFVHRPTQLVLAVKKINCLSGEEDRRKEIKDLDVPLRAGDSQFIVKFYGGMFAEGKIYILNEIMDTSLDKFYLKAKDILIAKLDEHLLSKVAFSVLHGINFLKSREIMHRDIKPSNMLLNRDGTIKLCDFGISGYISNSTCLTFAGCYAYMSPEKIRMETMACTPPEGYTIKSDIWSLGISLIEIATYNHPFESYQTFCAKMAAILSDTPPRLPQQGFSSVFCAFVETCLQKDVNLRGDVDLLEHEFITNYSSPLSDTILAFIQHIITLIEADLSPE